MPNIISYYSPHADSKEPSASPTDIPSNFKDDNLSVGKAIEDQVWVYMYKCVYAWIPKPGYMLHSEYSQNELGYQCNTSFDHTLANAMDKPCKLDMNHMETSCTT